MVSKLGERPASAILAAAAENIGPMWASNQFNDLYMDAGSSDHAASKEMLDLREAVLSAAESSPHSPKSSSAQ